MTGLLDLQYGFEACQMKSVSPEVFKYCPNAYSAYHTFHRCNKLKEIPQGLFDNNPKLTNFECCFKSCTSVVSVPFNLFDKCDTIKNVNECFCGGRWNGDNGYNRYMSIGSGTEGRAIPQLWQKYPNIPHTRYAAGCIKASNWQEIRDNNWY